MEFIRLTKENLHREHICCAISNDNDVQVKTKKAWLEARLDEGLVFLKANVRGKCFIEYIPAERAWCPIEADGYMYIDCLWVSGSLKGQGFSGELLGECERDARSRGMKGIAVLSSDKKRGFISDRGYLAHAGFEVCDAAPPYFLLMYLPFDGNTVKPRFCDSVKQTEHTGMPAGFTLYYTDQCPFNAKYVPLLEKRASERGVPFNTVHIVTAEQSRLAPIPFTTFALFHNGVFITHEIQSEKKFDGIIDTFCNN